MRGFRLVEMTMKRKQQGFTLLEIMLVVTIIALLLGTAIYKLAPRAGINCTKTCQKIPGRTNTFTVIPVRKTQAATTCIPRGPIGKQTQRTTIGASEARRGVDLALLFGLWQLGVWAIWRASTWRVPWVWRSSWTPRNRPAHVRTRLRQR